MPQGHQEFGCALPVAVACKLRPSRRQLARTQAPSPCDLCIPCQGHKYTDDQALDTTSTKVFKAPGPNLLANARSTYRVCNLYCEFVNVFLFPGRCPFVGLDPGGIPVLPLNDIFGIRWGSTQKSMTS